MAEYRPYCVTNKRAQARLTQVKLISVSSFTGLALLINWRVTRQAARLLNEFSRQKNRADQAGNGGSTSGPLVRIPSKFPSCGGRRAGESGARKRPPALRARPPLPPAPRASSTN